MQLLFNEEVFNLRNKHLIMELFSVITQELSQGEKLRSENIYLLSKEVSPMCSHIDDTTCAILLHCPDDFTGLQYAYQFAHEFCHWMINGELSGELQGLFWLEETLCELSSFYCLVRLQEKWSELHHQVVSQDVVDSYTSQTISSSQPLAQLPLKGYIDTYQKLLSQEEYHRPLYSQMAGALLPAFLRRPSLWKLLPYIADMKDFHTVDTWIHHVRQRIPRHIEPELAMLSYLFLGDQ